MRVTAENISRTFYRNGHGTNVFYAVQETDFALQAGELAVLTGRSGSGKTTLSNMLAGLLRPTQGRVLLDLSEDETAEPVDLFALSDNQLALLRNRHIGIIPQGQTGLQSLTVLENVMAPALMYGLRGGKNSEIKGEKEPVITRARELLERMEMGELTDVYSNELSGGELRRMSIARALVNDPALIIADEPTGDLDDETTEKVLSLLRERADQGAAVLIVTHESGTIEYADSVYRMSGGKLESLS